MTNISYFGPVSTGINRTKTILFKPFDIGKWFVLGFAAWLAIWGESTPGQFNLNLPYDFSQANTEAASSSASEFTGTYLAIFIAITILVFAVVVGLWAVLQWVNSRATFVFLDDVVRNRADMAEPWRNYSRQGNSLFLWRLIFSLICLLIVVALVICTILLCLPLSSASTWVPLCIFGIIMLVFSFIGILFVMGYTDLFLKDFIAPIMYRLDLKTTEAWQVFLRLFRPRIGTFLLYGVAKLLICAVINSALLIIMLMSCLLCCIGIVFMIPYISSVVTLPITIFLRVYSLAFIAQFGPEYDCFLPPPISMPEASVAIA